MQPIKTNDQETTEAKPIQVGSQPGEVKELSQEISQSGVAKSEADVERSGTEGPDTGESSPPTFPTPIITSS